MTCAPSSHAPCSAQRSAWSVAAACGYDPNPESGMLQCGSVEHLPGRLLLQERRCWLAAQAAAGQRHAAAAARAAAARGGSSRPTSSSAPGRSSPPSTRMIARAPTASTENKDWSGLGRDRSTSPRGAGGGAGDLLLLQLGPGRDVGRHLDRDQTGRDAAAPPTTPSRPRSRITWHGEAFTLSTTQRHERHAGRRSSPTTTRAPPVPGRARCTSPAPMTKN